MFLRTPRRSSLRLRSAPAPANHGNYGAGYARLCKNSVADRVIRPKGWLGRII